MDNRRSAGIPPRAVETAPPAPAYELPYSVPTSSSSQVAYTDSNQDLTAFPSEFQAQLISIVIPMYREEKNIARLIEALDQALAFETQYNWEYILVNDGSPDRTIYILETISAHHPRCRVVDLSRNFGKEIALTAGVHYARGAAVICMDADLQHPPLYIPSFLRLWEAGNEVVVAVRKRTENESLFRRTSSHLFYWLMRKFSEVDMLAKTTDFRLLDRKVVLAMDKIGERQRIFRGLVDWLGFRRATIEFEAHERAFGKASYSISKLIELAINSFVSYSTLPLIFIGLVGTLVTSSSAILLSWMLYVRFFLGDKQTFTPLAFFTVANTLLFGIVVAMLGLISLYIRKIYGETLNRPLFVVRQTIGFEANNSPQLEHSKQETLHSFV